MDGSNSEGQVSRQRKRRIEQRFKLFQDNGALANAHYHLAATTIGLDLLIIDNRYMIITVPYRGGVEGFKYGLLFYRAPEIVDEFVDWFDNVLLKNVEPIKFLSDIGTIPHS